MEKKATAYLEKSDIDLLIGVVGVGIMTCPDGTPYTELTEQQLSKLMYQINKLQQNLQSVGDSIFWRKK